MTRLLARLLSPMFLLITACGVGNSDSSTAGPTTQRVATVAQSTTPIARADCQPRTVTFETDADGPNSVTPVLPDDDAPLAAAVADSFCSLEWESVLPDGTKQTIAARALLPSDDAACIADQLVGVLGKARVIELGLGAGPWSLVGFGLSGNSGANKIERAEAESIVDVFIDCSDRWKLLLILSVTEGADKISDESAACVADRLTDDDAKEMLIGEIDRAYDDPSQPHAKPFPDTIQPVIAAYRECLSADEFGNLDFN